MRCASAVIRGKPIATDTRGRLIRLDALLLLNGASQPSPAERRRLMAVPLPELHGGR